MTTKTFETRQQLDRWLKQRKIPADQADAARREFDIRLRKRKK